jgi:hypothetical protein
MNKLFFCAVAVLALLLSSPFERSAQGATNVYVVDDKNLSHLRADFNANVGKVRLLYVVGPTCGPCLRGLSDMQEALYSKGDNPRIVTFVVYVPTYGAHESNVEPAAQLITNSHTTHYWEESGIIGRKVQQTMNFPKYTWDYWSVYDARTVWSDAQKLPAPAYWMHQFEGLPPELQLDANVLAAKVDEILARSPRAAAASTTTTR